MAAACARADGPGPALGGPELQRLRAAMAAKVDASEGMPGPGARVTLAGQPVWSAAGPDRVLLSAFTVRFAKVTNTYCRVGVADPSLAKVELIPVPPRAGNDACLRLGPVYWLDVNGDGRLDAVHGVTVTSNANGARVVEAVVYLSDPASPTGYCYSGAASAQLTPESLASAEVVAAKLAAAKKRLQLTTFPCGP